MITLKQDVEINGIRPETVLAISIAASVMAKHNQDLMVTSVRDGVHMEGSRHYTGHAFDMRSNTMTAEQIAAVRQELTEALGPDFDVVVEKLHIHVEFDKRGELH